MPPISAAKSTHVVWLLLDDMRGLLKEKLNSGERKTLKSFGFMEKSMPNDPGMFVVAPSHSFQTLLCSSPSTYRWRESWLYVHQGHQTPSVLSFILDHVQRWNNWTIQTDLDLDCIIYLTVKSFQYLSLWFMYLALYLCSLYQNDAWLVWSVSLLQNSKPDSLLKMEEEHKFEKTPLGHRDNRFSFTMSHKKLLGYVYHCV